jgi:DnaJ-class molecular chaperone
MPRKKNSRGYSRSLEATNKFFTENAFFAKPKSRKNKVYDPNSKYYSEGGENEIGALPKARNGITYVEDPNDPAFKFFKRVGDGLQHLETTVSLSLSESLIGCTVRIDGHPGYDEGLFIKIPAGSFNGDKYCLTGFGMPIPGNIGKYGDLFIKIDVSVKPAERSLFASKGREVLLPLFEDRIRRYECSEDSIQKDLYLHKQG